MNEKTLRLNELALAIELEQKGDIAAAQTYARRAAAFFKTENNQEGLCSALAILCRTLVAGKEFQEAELRLLQAVSLKRKLQHAPAETAHYLDMLAGVCKYLGKTDMSIRACRESLNAKRAAFGEVSRQVADSLSLLGSILLERKEFDKAEHCLSSAADIFSGALGAERTETTVARCRLASAKAALGDLPGAADLFSRAAEALNTPMGAADTARLEYLDRYAVFLRNSGKQQEAIRVESQFFQLAARLNGFSLE